MACTDADLRAAGYVPASELDALRAEVEALKQTPSVEELAQEVADQLTATADVAPIKFLVAQIAKEAVRVTLRVLGRGAE